jgi:hypothetical protein
MNSTNTGMAYVTGSRRLSANGVMSHLASRTYPEVS